MAKTPEVTATPTPEPAEPTAPIEVPTRAAEPAAVAELNVDDSTSDPSVDPDLQMLSEAEAAIAVEEPESGTPTPDPEPAPTPDPEPQPAPIVAAPAAPAAPAVPEPTPEPQPEQMVPISRLNEVSRQRDEARMATVYHQGVAETLRETAPSAPAAPAEPPPPTVEDARQEIANQRLALGKRFDDGEMTSVEQQQALMNLETQTRRIDDYVLQQHLLAQQPAAVAPAPAPPTEELLLQERTAEMLVNREYLTDGRVGPERVNFLEREVKQAAVLEGKPIVAGNPADTLRLRRGVAELSDRYLPLWGIDKSSPAVAPATPQPQSGQAPLSADAKALLAKTKAAEGYPPDTTKMGSPADDPAAVLSDEVALGRMTPQDLETLVESGVTERVLAQQ